VVPSADGTPITYQVQGDGEPTLVFVHGWSCDARYWRRQVPAFSGRHRVVTLDLAGHGHSGSSRTAYSMKAFGDDVLAVLRDVGGDSFILIGHSMGGPVIASAARLSPKGILGLIAVDTLHNVELPLSLEAVEQMKTPLLNDFPAGCHGFVESMMEPHLDPGLREWILADMASALPSVALSAFEEMMSLYLSGEITALFDGSPIPVIGIYADLWPVDPDANRRHMASFDPIVIPQTGHFLMLSDPERFNPALEQAITRVQETPSELSPP
jgi:pimeloyl-ACP methyl ester carboxylesterase